MANRGEIARRIFRSAAGRGMRTVAVYSDADADALFVREADAAVRLPGTAPADTYLRGDLLIAAAVRAGADCVHPGYGFLSENADFARNVIAAGLEWIGPPAEAIEAMGSKTAAKALMTAAGVPTAPSADASDIDGDSLPRGRRWHRIPLAGQGFGRRRRPWHARCHRSRPVLAAVDVCAPGGGLGVR